MVCARLVPRAALIGSPATRGSIELLLLRWEVGSILPCVPEERLYKRDEIQLRGERAHRGGDDRLDLLAGVPLPRQDKGNMAILQGGTTLPGEERVANAVCPSVKIWTLCDRQ